MTIRLKTKNLYIIRHGQTDFNLQKKVQGRGIDASINETGKSQANEFYQSFHNVPFDKIYTSNLRRTRESVQQFIDQGIPAEALEGLDEISWGDHEGQEFDPEMHQIYLNTVAGWERGELDKGVSGGESPLEVMQRQKQAIKVITENNDHQNILIATHGRAMRILICWLLNYPLEYMDVFKHANLCLYHLELINQRYRILRQGSTDHLSD